MRSDEGTLDLACLPLAPNLDNPDRLARCYPLVPLDIEPVSQMMSMRTVILESEFLRVTVLPDLGGRILQIQNLGTADELLSASGRLDVEAAGVRGARVASGLQWNALGLDRGQSVAPVEYEIRTDDTDVPVLLMHELSAGAPVSVHASINLEPDAPMISVVLRSINGSSKSVILGNCGIELPANLWRTCSGEWGICGTEHPDWLMVFHTPGEQLRSTGSGVSLELNQGALGPFDTLAYEVRIYVVRNACPGVLPVAVGPGVWMHVSDGKVHLSGALEVSAATLGLTTRDGDTFQAPVHLGPGKTFSAALVGNLADPQRLSLWAKGGEALLEFPGASNPSASSEAASVALFDLAADSGASSNHPCVRHALPLARVRSHLSEENWDAADHALDESLAWHAENPLTWWLKAVVARHHSSIDPDLARQALVTAHYLAPLDPLLRSASFLSQSQEMDSGPNPLVEPLANHPEALVYVACSLIEWGLIRDAARWLDECLRHRAWPQLRLLYAYLLLDFSRMEFEAAAQLKMLSAEPIEPPFPWRAIERTAIHRLHARFGDDARLGQLSRLIDRALP